MTPPIRYVDLADGLVAIASDNRCHCEEGAARRGNPFSFRSLGSGRGFASQGMRIATPLAGLAMTR